jgi:hypothetical protein
VRISSRFFEMSVNGLLVLDTLWVGIKLKVSSVEAVPSLSNNSHGADPRILIRGNGPR